ncbi:MAG: hypothetical protein A2Y13_08590 [Planctomycetes bacterium GWC2_45_44]|nr:MAG: hypothetical protein A2Y13_08590 [Planctomycetes bacterium GWC2_45_44]
MCYIFKKIMTKETKVEHNLHISLYFCKNIRFLARANASNFSTPCYYLKKAVLKFLVVLYECQKHL